MKNYKISEIKEILTHTGLPVAYDHFKEKTPLPFISFIQAGTVNINADNKAYYTANKYNIELYTSEKDEKTEDKIQEILNNNEIPWRKSEDIRIETENITEIIYYI